MLESADYKIYYLYLCRKYKINPTNIIIYKQQD